MRESYIVSKVVAFAEKQGFLHRKVLYAGRKGAPDDWFFGAGARLEIIEFKAPGEQPDAVQEREIARLRKLGFNIHVVDDVDKGIKIFL
jgi:hypothetical protein